MRTLFTAISLMVVATGTHAGGHAPPSTFQNSCSNISFQYNATGGAEIHAVCLRADGTPNSTSIDMPPIANIDGMLKMQGDVATFQASCGSIKLETTADFVTLYANCRTTSGGILPTSIGVPGIDNLNGVLSN